MRRSLLLLATVASFTLLAQDRTAVRFTGVVRSWDQDSTATSIAITAVDTVPGAAPIHATCDAKGTCRLELPLDRVYRIAFSAARHATAHLLLDTHGPSLKQRKWGYRVRVALTMAMLGEDDVRKQVAAGKLPGPPFLVATAPVFDPVLDHHVSERVFGDLGTKMAGKHAIVQVAKRIPFVGGPVGAATDGYFTYALGQYARREFVRRRR